MHTGTYTSARGLLPLAGEISSHVSVSDLAKCLKISLDDVTFNASDTDRDKIYTLFMLWMSANRTEDSMAKLLTHLEQLNNACIDKIIKEYRKDYYDFHNYRSLQNQVNIGLMPIIMVFNIYYT
jgi:hypothetical protein